MKLFRNKIVIPIAAILFIVLLSSITDNDENFLDKLIAHFNKYTSEYTQQKIYLHFDKPSYSSGDNVWFKAYVINGTTHLPDTLSTNMYLEMIDYKSRIVQTRLIEITNGSGYGDFYLSDTITEGIYLIRAFTNWMKNFNESFFYTNYLKIYNPNERVFISEEDYGIRSKKRIQKKAEKFDINFYPEGGALLRNVSNKIAFKSTDGFGKGIFTEGIISDDKNNEIVSFTSSDMGYGIFTFTPLPNKKYFAQITPINGKTIKYPLPKAVEKGLALSIPLISEDSLIIDIRANQIPSGNSYSSELFLIGQVRGKIYIAESLNINSLPSTRIFSLNNFPEGIMQISLVNNQNKILSERLCFLKNNKRIYFNLNADDITESADGQVNIVITASDSDGNPVASDFSISVLPGKIESIKENIISNFLFTSDLEENFEKPAIYFRENSSLTREEIDILLMTQKDNNFLWNDLFLKNFPKTKFDIEKGISLSGKISKMFFKFPVENAIVNITLYDDIPLSLMNKTNKDGKYTFDYLNFHDTIDMKILAEKEDGSENIIITVDETISPPVKFSPDASLLKELMYLERKKTEPFKIRRKYKTDRYDKDGERTDIRRSGLQRYSDNVVNMDETANTYSNVLESLRGRVPGVRVTGSGENTNVLVRGIYGYGPPLFLIDGIPTDQAAVNMLHPESVEKIEVTKGADALIYGSRGTNGVIEVFTKDGGDLEIGDNTLTIIGYSSIRKFYPSIRRQSDGEKTVNLPSTLYWDPDIKTDDSGNTTISFPKPENISEMTIIVEGISNNGTAGSNIFEIK